MTAAIWWLQAAYLLGFLAFFGAGAKRRRVKMVGWATGAVSEVAFSVWATLAHVPSAYPWVVAWGGVYCYNAYKWRGHAVSEGETASGTAQGGHRPA